ncbi:hypothetical protein M2459_001559 [Parabacteroides sp. PF5-5]|uniref:hypothetical protein n=1 Tax=unclassified Parabacteroides TaxID=2649774 RepID=UPI002474EB5F|nr:MULTISPECIES: hypothetical protein [unclassified Parabacteroides]MDH6304823.1 hypothetical protein [Parabacteroides sp. PH5-39]MDH6315563.1 hypothetical protein [Parabacteroides sp. PF5-13]MDH6319223.1 hypothetical protein [Parabacteroides sp. PH5-13]MDH6322954.1 hypothetical protein [Parabacteroides sp. PH5-8]MDH6326756.1 hypothetical protein [Parabacteroides sp. PH5-41]
MTNQEFLTEYILKDITAYLMDDEGIDMTTALRFIYNSETYTKLIDAETGLYTQSSAYVYEFLKDEYHLGKLSASNDY